MFLYLLETSIFDITRQHHYISAHVLRGPIQNGCEGTDITIEEIKYELKKMIKEPMVELTRKKMGSGIKFEEAYNKAFEELYPTYFDLAVKRLQANSEFSFGVNDEDLYD